MAKDYRSHLRDEKIEQEHFTEVPQANQADCESRKSCESDQKSRILVYSKRKDRDIIPFIQCNWVHKHRE